MNRPRRPHRAGISGWLGILLIAGALQAAPTGPTHATRTGPSQVEIFALGPPPSSMHPFLAGTSVNATQLSAFTVERLGHINELQNTLELPLLDAPVAGLLQASYLLRLKPDTRFSDGSPLTAQDIAASYRRLYTWASDSNAPAAVVALARCFFLLETLRARDGRTLELSFRRPVRSEELAPMLASLPVLPADAPDDALHSGTAPSLAPYRLEKNPGNPLRLKANPHYPLGTPAITSVLVHYVAEAELIRLLNDETLEKPASPDQARLVVLPPGLADQAQRRPELRVRVADSRRVLVLGFNHGSSSRLAQQGELRRALATLLDPQALREGLPMPDWIRTPLSGPYVLDRRYEHLFRTLPQLKSDPAQARATLAKLGYLRNGETLRDAQGNPLTLSLRVDPKVPSGALLGGLIAEQLRREGIDILKTSADPDTSGKRWDLLLQEWTLDEDEGYSELLSTRGVFNPLQLRDARLDSLLNLERSAMLLASRERYRREIQTRLAETASALWLWQRRDAVAMSLTLHTAEALDPYYLFRAVHRWWIGEAPPPRDVQTTPSQPPVEMPADFPPLEETP